MHSGSGYEPFFWIEGEFVIISWTMYRQRCFCVGIAGASLLGGIRSLVFYSLSFLYDDTQIVEEERWCRKGPYLVAPVLEICVVNR